MDKQDYIDKIKNMMYDSNFSEGTVYTKPYSKSVILKSLEDSAEGYNVIYIDFDRLKEVNDTYGEDEADIGMKNIIDIYYKYLPEGSMFLRYGGDEFVAIVPCEIKRESEVEKWEQDRVEKAIDKANQEIASCDEKITYTLTATARVTDTNHAKDVYEALHKSMDKVELAKVERDGAANKDTLKGVLQHYIKKFFQTIRLEKDKFKSIEWGSDGVLNEEGQMFAAFNSMVLSTLENLLRQKAEEYKPENTNYDKKTDKMLLTAEEAKIAHEFLKNQTNSTSDILDELIEKTFDCVRKDPTTGLYNKLYAETSLYSKLESEGSDITILLFDTGGVKQSNLIDGHAATDEKLVTVAALIQDKEDIGNILKGSVRSSSTDESKHRDHVIDDGGGVFVTLLENCRQDMVKNVQTRIENNMNRELAKKYSNNHLNITTYAIKVHKGEKISDKIKNGKKELDAKKDQYKIKQLGSETVARLLAIFLKPCVDKYMETESQNLSDEQRAESRLKFENQVAYALYDIADPEELAKQVIEEIQKDEER